MMVLYTSASNRILVVFVSTIHPLVYRHEAALVGLHQYLMGLPVHCPALGPHDTTATGPPPATFAYCWANYDLLSSPVFASLDISLKEFIFEQVHITALSCFSVFLEKSFSNVMVISVG
jgi:hypothetical protein